MLRTVLLCLLVFSSTPALALYKCKSGDSITYSDQQCPGGQVLDANVPPADASRARKQADEDKKQLKHLENARRKQEAQEEKQRQRAAHEHAVKQKRCSLLAQRKKWADEDASKATGKSTERAQLKARRVAEQVELECGKVAVAG
ncbi:MAG: hypothetical protein V7642_6449 [Burkholderiales bacterium]|jgi:hypothetical protein